MRAPARRSRDPLY